MLIGILQTDSVRERFRPEFGDYPDMFTRLLDAARPGALSYLTIDCLAMRYPEPGACDAYLITGSKCSVYDDEPWIEALADFVGAVLGSGGKVVGVCFGHQLVAHFFGGRTQHVGWAVGVQATEVVQHASWMEPSMTRVGLLSSHQDQVVELPSQASAIMRTPFCPISGYVMGDQVLALQGHPEFTKGYSAALMNMRQELLGASTFEQGMASLSDDTHEQEVAQWMLGFMEGR